MSKVAVTFTISLQSFTFEIQSYQLESVGVSNEGNDAAIEPERVVIMYIGMKQLHKQSFQLYSINISVLQILNLSPKH